MQRPLIIAILLVVVTLAVYSRTVSNEFVNYDDSSYVYENSHVKTGLNIDNIEWAFTTFQAANWHPLTWLSHMADVELYGMSPGGHHVTNVLFHCANALLLFLLLNRMTGALWPSAFAAALFALHPLRVESVTWVAERKDVLSSFFALLSLLAYTLYTEKPAIGRYVTAIILFALGLMAKPMLVTLPIVMLLLDYWPLNRLDNNSIPSADCLPTHPPSASPSPRTRLLIEKIPFALLSLASCILTIIAQRQNDAIIPLETYSLTSRIANALITYVTYLGKMLWPHKLAVFYPLSPHSPVMLAVAAAIIAAISFASIRLFRKLPFLLTGWLWYLVTLIPVIGLVQVGLQSMADRYTYLPMIGIGIMIAWGASTLTKHLPTPVGQYLIVIGAVALLSGSSLLTWRQQGYWRNSLTLYRHAIAVTDNNYFALANLGSYLYDRHDYLDAANHYELSLRAKPDQFDVHHNLGLTFKKLGNYEKSEYHFQESLRIRPNHINRQYDLTLYADTQYELALVRAKRNRLVGAINGFHEVLKVFPNHTNAHYNAAVAYARLGKTDDAIRHFTEVLRLEPLNSEARTYLETYRKAK